MWKSRCCSICPKSESPTSICPPLSLAVKRLMSLAGCHSNTHPLPKAIILVFLRFLIFANHSILIFANGRIKGKRLLRDIILGRM